MIKHDTKIMDADGVLKDVELVWDNCWLYNTIPGSKILRMLAEAEKLFHSLWREAGLSERRLLHADSRELATASASGQMNGLPVSREC